ncbi:MAG: hypothetical protein E7469_06080 [Ruminococcaceae bacterium]|nr:hypothetical protein [Oscillospiraceae bacterium]
MTKKKGIACAALAVLVCAAVAVMLVRGSGAKALRDAVAFPADAAVEAELWRGGEKLPLQVSDPHALLAALGKADYVKKGAVDVIAPDEEAYVLTVMTDSRMEKFTILPQEGTGYWAGETPAMFRCAELVEALRGLKEKEKPTPTAGYVAPNQNPQVFTCSAGTQSADEAAMQLAHQLLESMTVPSDARTFTILEYKDVAVVCYATEELSADMRGAYGLQSEEIGPNMWLVEINASYRYEGTISPVGPGGGQWFDQLTHGGPYGWLLCRVGGEYTLQTRNQ